MRAGEFCKQAVSNLAAIQSTLEAAGIEFTDGEAPGIRMWSKPIK
jgi:hypothetical protein